MKWAFLASAASPEQAVEALGKQTRMDAAGGRARDRVCRDPRRRCGGA